ncbi:MAG: patatin family protein [Clostridia bacterium]|nr:patatin family protein [Clostridia bacterium]
MKKYKSALVVEGGALRGIHTAGVMDTLMRCNIYFPYVIGVSAGALNTFNYISHQIGRSADILLHYIRDSRYLNLLNIPSRKESAFGFDFMFYGLQEYLPFDLDTFNDPAQAFTVVATDVADGSAVYYRKGECSDIFKAGAASASLPLLSPPVELDGHCCIDGGVADPIPFLKAMEECDKVVVLLTRHKGFRKRTMPFAERETAKQLYKNAPQMLEAALSANDRYNDTLDLLEQMEYEGKLFVIRPSKEIDISLLERNTENLGKLYQEGVQDGEDVLCALSEYLGQTNALLQFAQDGSLRRRKYEIGNYTSAEQLDAQVRSSVRRGPRLTGNTAHQRILENIYGTLSDMGVRVHSDPYYFYRETDLQASLTVPSEDMPESFSCVAMPYAGLTGSEPVCGMLYDVRDKSYRFIGARGKIAVVHMDAEDFRSSARFETVFSVPDDLTLPESFGSGERLASLSFLSLAKMAGVKGVVCIRHDVPSVPDVPLPYAQQEVGIPCVWVGADEGARLLEYMDRTADAEVQLQVTAQALPHACTQTLYCILPGSESGESVLLQTHTEGINAVENNGPAALLALIEALRDKPLRRTHIFIFSSGRFRLPMFRAASGGCGKQWLSMHRDLWDGKDGHLRAVAALTAEHLGIGDLPDVVFSSNTGLDGVYRKALEHRAVPEAIVLRAYAGIFGEGQPLHEAGIPTLAFAAEDAQIWQRRDLSDRFSAERMLSQIQTMLDCLTLLDEMPKESVGRVQRQPLRSILPYSERGTKHEKSDD